MSKREPESPQTTSVNAVAYYSIQQHKSQIRQVFDTPQHKRKLKRMDKRQKKEITIDELAQMVARGFESTASKTDIREMEKRLDRRIDGLEIKFSAYASQWSQDFERLHDWVKELDQRIGAVEKKK